MRTQTKLLTFTRRDTVTGPLMLVNAKHPLAPEHQSGNGPLVENQVVFGQDPAGKPVLLHREAAKMMRLLLEAVNAGGCIAPVSGFRPHGEQAAIFEDTLREKGEAFTRKYVALPGCSEHETGLALDLTDTRQAYDFLTPAFPYEGICATFRQLAPRYGFIERYPKGKEAVTGIGHEPWHFRYVGWPHAAAIAEAGWTLEEYIQALHRRTGPDDALVYRAAGRTLRSFTLPVSPEGAAQLEHPAKAPWQASGNNCGGMVVTLWQ